MVPLWFTLSALCFVGAAVLLYVDIDADEGWDGAASRGRSRMASTTSTSPKISSSDGSAG